MLPNHDTKKNYFITTGLSMILDKRKFEIIPQMVWENTRGIGVRID
jgi:hypothetical protein